MLQEKENFSQCVSGKNGCPFSFPFFLWNFHFSQPQQQIWMRTKHWNSFLLKFLSVFRVKAIPEFVTIHLSHAAKIIWKINAIKCQYSTIYLVVSYHKWHLNNNQRSLTATMRDPKQFFNVLLILLSFFIETEIVFNWLLKNKWLKLIYYIFSIKIQVFLA